jgi:hypothetical protein
MLIPRVLAAITLCLAQFGCSGLSSDERAEAKANRAKILSLISVGDSFEQAGAKLTNAGFKFSYAKPIDPTGCGEYLQQLVSVHPSLLKPSPQSSFRYAVGMAPSKSEIAPYVVVDADPTGIITKLK